MKKVLFLILPLFFISSSLFSYDISKNYISTVRDGSTISGEQDLKGNDLDFNRPTIKTPLFSKTVIINKNGMDESSFASFGEKYIPTIYSNSIHGICLTEPVNDPKQALYMLLSGIQPNLHGCKNGSKNKGLDDLLLVAKQNGKKVAIFSDLEFVSDEKSLENLQLIIKEWKSLDLIVFDFNRQQNTEQWKSLYLDPILHQLSDTELLYFFSIIPESTIRPFTRVSQYYESPFLLMGKKVNTNLKSIKSKHENITATIALSTGLSLPGDCLGYPELDFFTIPEKDKIDRGMSLIKNYIINSVRLLYQYNINESIIEGYLIESSDSIDLSLAKTTKDLYQRWTAMNQEMKSFTLETRQKVNLSISLIFLVLFLFCFILWLLFSVKFYRSFVFGILLTAVFLLLNYFVFKVPVSIPSNNLFYLRWYIFRLSIPLFVSAFLVSTLYTILSGYIFDITLTESIKDINGIISTLYIFLLGELTVIINLNGFHSRLVAPGYFFISLIIRNLSLLVLFSFVLFFMYIVSLLTYKILTKYGPKTAS